LFAAGLLSSQHALPALHHALVRHEICAAHGELVHTGETHAETKQFGSVSIDGVRAEHSDTDHCGVIPASPPRAPAAPTSIDWSFSAPVLEVAAISSGTNATVPDVLAFAPKQSPPV